MNKMNRLGKPGKNIFAVVLSMTVILSNIGSANLQPVSAANADSTTNVATQNSNETQIVLSDSGTKVDGEDISTSSSSAVYQGADIIYYKANQGSDYGAGSSNDEHTEEEAAKNTVITITSPGTYRISGTLSNGQVAIDLGEDAQSDSNAVVNLILDNANINCDVAPGVIFYNVWESESTTEAGANVVIADDSVNTVNGSYVAKIYKTGTTKKLHKYDGAFYSKESMIVSGETKNNGILNINAENEGLDSELHLTINGGVINIKAQDDGINTNEDNVSIFTMNAGSLYINAGNGSEGDGIDSNGYLYINGGKVISIANGTSPDGGLDSDCGTYINGGTIVALGIKTDEISSESKAPYMLLNYSSVKQASELIRITEKDGDEIISYLPEKKYQSVVISTPALKLNTTYNVYSGGTITNATSTKNLYESGGTYTGGTLQQYTGTASDSIGGQPGGNNQGTPPEKPTGNGQSETSSGETPPAPPTGNEQSETPSGQTPPAPPTGNGQSETPSRQTPPAGNPGQNNGNNNSQNGSVSGSTDFTITEANKTFSGITNYIATSEKETTGSDSTETTTNTVQENTTAQTTTGEENNSTVITTNKIKVKATKITKISRNKNNKKISLKLKKIKTATGYQVKYSTSKKFEKKLTKIRTSKNNTLKLTKINRKKTYYIKARTYKKVNGKKYYSKWSKIRIVK